MTYRLYDTGQGQFALCWDTCCQFIKSYHRASLQHRHSREVTESQSQMLNPSTWGMPDLTYLSVDWHKVRQESAANTLSDAWRLGAVATFSGGGVAKFQDSGSYGSAAIEVTQNIAFSVFQTTKAVKVVVSVTADTFKALIEGEGHSIGTALAEGGVNVPAAVLGEVAKKLLGPLMDKVAVPVVTKVITASPQVLASYRSRLAQRSWSIKPRRRRRLPFEVPFRRICTRAPSCRRGLHWPTPSASMTTCC